MCAYLNGLPDAQGGGTLKNIRFHWNGSEFLFVECCVEPPSEDVWIELEE